MSGKLIIAGGNLEFCDKEIHKILVDHASKLGGKLAIVPTASGFEPFESIKYVEDIWKELGVKDENIVALPVYGQEGNAWQEPAQGDDPKIVEMLDGVVAFWFTGGNQYYTHKAFIRKDLTDTLALQKMKEIYKNGGVIGGTSAGAAIMSEVMIASGTNATALSKPIEYGYETYDDDEEDPGLRLVRGLGFFTDGVIDQHFDKRSRLLRLINAVMDSKDLYFGYGVSEDTALIYDLETKDITVAGSGAVYIVDLRKTKTEQFKNKYVCNDVVLNIIQKGHTFNQWKI